MLDPEHRFLADRRFVALHQPAIAPQQPHFIRTLLPAIGRLGRDGDRISVIAFRHVDLREERRRQQQEDERETRPTQRASAHSLHVPSCGCSMPRSQASRGCAAVLVGADLSPSRFSRLASLLAWPNGETANCKRKSRKPLRKTEYGGEIIEIGGRGSKRGRRKDEGGRRKGGIKQDAVTCSIPPSAFILPPFSLPTPTLPVLDLFQDLSHRLQGIAVETPEGFGDPRISADGHLAKEAEFAYLIAISFKHKISCAQFLEPIQNILELIFRRRIAGRSAQAGRNVSMGRRRRLIQGKKTACLRRKRRRLPIWDQRQNPCLGENRPTAQFQSLGG